MIFKFEPSDDEKFKSKAVNNKIVSVVVDSITNEIILSFTRKVRKKWDQSCKNNIETDHRIRELTNDKKSEKYIVYTCIL